MNPPGVTQLVDNFKPEGANETTPNDYNDYNNYKCR